jgi:hypothetical protein
MKFYVSHRLHFQLGDQRCVAVERTDAQQLPRWIMRDSLYQAALRVGWIRPDSEPAAISPPEPAQPVAEKRVRRQAK